MLNYQIFHPSKTHQLQNKLIQRKTSIPSEIKPDIVVDFMQSPRIFLAKKFADILTEMNLIGVERIKDTFHPNEDAWVNIDIGDEKELKVVEKVYVHFHVFNRYDILDEDKTLWFDPVKKNGFGAISMLILDENKLSKIPLAERLMFKIDQDASFLLVHDSIVDKLIEANAQNIWVRWGEQ